MDRTNVVAALETLGMKGAIRSALDVLSVARGAMVYSRTSKTPEPSYQSMIRLFCATKGLSNDALSWALSLARPPLDLPPARGALGDLSADDVARITRVLDERGYYVIENALSEELIGKLLDFTRRTPAVVRGSSQRLVFEPGKPRGVRYDYDPADLAQDPTVQRLFADASILAVGQSYLRSAPVHDILTMWWHTAFSKEPDKDAAQFFHFDMDRLRWIKFFFYLTDVAPENGPHTFVAGSHRRNGIPSELLRQGYARLSDDEVKRHYKPQDLIEFTGRRGTVIIEDTRGLHKGRHVEQGERLVLQLQLSNSFFGTVNSRVKVGQVRDEL
ncbi:MAG: phytanoyl-CoA dioxygenase family protein, partial [Deltaproteobacteria bacterium]|nr:phytanoyl-CoA dioxygenase family protein [Deltaproteobacteria bacterium]